MEQEKRLAQILELEREIAMLPEGSITKKNIKGKDYYYHRININGKRIEKYIQFGWGVAYKEETKTICYVVYGSRPRTSWLGKSISR